MFNLLKSEVCKIKNSRELKLCMLLIGFLELIKVLNKVTPNGRISLASSNGDLLILMISALFVGMFITSEFSKRTISHLIIAGHSRLKVYLSKYISYMIGMLIIILTSLFFRVGIYTIIYGWGTSLNSQIIYFIIIYSILNALCMLSLTSIVFIVPFIIKDIGASIGVSAVMSMFIFSMTLSLTDMITNIADGIVNGKSIMLIGVFVIPITIITVGYQLFKSQDIK